MLNAEFVKLPVLFLKTYQRQLLAWSADLERVGPMIELDLLVMPNAPVLDMASVPQKVRLVCEVLKHPVSGDVKFLIGPADEMSAEVIAKHVEQLPRILQARRLAADRAARERGHMDAVFDGIPDEFVAAYQPELRRWGFEFKKYGREYTVPLRRVPGVEPDYDDEGREVQYGVALVAEIDRAGERVRLVISPKDAQARERLARHVKDIKRHGEPLAAGAMN